MDSDNPMRSRSILTHTQAREIFLLKADIEIASLHAVSLRLAKQYNVGAKAIRDIWIGRSWLEATFDLWEAGERPPRKTIGRPKGRKDSRPRQTKASKTMIAGGGAGTDSCGYPVHLNLNSAFACSTRCVQTQNYAPNVQDICGAVFGASFLNSTSNSSVTTAVPLPAIHRILPPEFSSTSNPLSPLSPDQIYDYPGETSTRIIVPHPARVNPSTPCPQQLIQPPLAANPFTAAGQPWPAAPTLAQLLRAQHAADCARQSQWSHSVSALSALYAQSYHSILAHLAQEAARQRAAPL